MKYMLTSETIEVCGKTLHRIEALKNFSDVCIGDLGGFVESLDNLSQEGNAWVSGYAWVYGDAQVYGNAQVSGDARVSGFARVFENAQEVPTKVQKFSKFMKRVQERHLKYAASK